MANLKRNMLKLVKNPEEAVKGGEIEFETFWTAPFIPTSVTYEAMDLAEEMEDPNKETSEREQLDKMGTFVADKLFGGQFTLEDIKNKFHGPDLIVSLRAQIYFIAQGEQTEDTKNFLAKKKK